MAEATIKSRLYNAIWNDIIDGVYDWNYVFNEKSLVEKYQVSKSPIRDALLAAGALGAGMSGSGPTVFGIFREEGLARAAQEKTLPLGESYAVRPLGKLT